MKFVEIYTMSVRFRNRESNVIMTITIEKALHPLRVTFSVLGFGVYFPEKAYLNIFYDLSIWIIYVCLYYYLAIELKVENRLFGTLPTTNTLISIFSIIISIIMSIYNNKRFQIFIKRLAAVDNTLEKLGTPKIYRKLHMYVKYILIGWLVFINVMNINDIYWWSTAIKNRYSLISFMYLTNHHFYVNMFTDLFLVILLWYIGTRFDKVNEHVRCLLVKKENELRCTRRKTVLTIHRNMYTNYYKYVLWTSMHLHLELCQLSREFNEMYGIHMTVEMINYMLFLIRYGKYFYINAHIKLYLHLSPLNWLSIVMWLLSFGTRLFCLNYACESVSAKANEMRTIIHQLTNFLQYADVRDEISQFTLQLIFRPLKFTGLGFFHFGNDFLRRFILVFVTFVIFIIQMVSLSDIYEYARAKNRTVPSCTKLLQ